MDIHIINLMDEIYTTFPYYGYRRMHQVLISKGYRAGKRKIAKFK